MPATTVRCSRSYNRPADAIWSILRDFASDWHPAIETCAQEITASGAVVRVFAGTDGGTYRERLTYLSDTDRRLSYVLESGIAGVTSYAGDVQVRATGESSCAVEWCARIDAPQDRLDQIAKGTAAIFESGLVALDAQSVPPARPAPKRDAVTKLETFRFEGDVTLSGLESPGAQADTLVLCLHGIGGAADNWRAQLEALGSTYKMMALDMRGYGGSTLGPAQSTVEDYCADILRVFEQSKAKRLILVGLSMGSWIATSFAMRHSELLSGVVLAGGCTGMSEASIEARTNFLSSRADPLAAGQTPADFAPSVVELIAGPHATQHQRAALAASMSAIPSASYLDALTCFTNPSETFDVSRITCPVLMLTGAHDRLAPPDEIRFVSLRIHAAGPTPDVRFEVLPTAGHVCNLEAPDVFNDHLSSFLSRLPDACLQHSPRDARKAQKRQTILDAALSEFSQNGFDGASMAAIASTAGVSKPTLYSYFGDKEGLFAAILEQGRVHLLTPLTGNGGSLVERLWAFSWTYADFVLRPDMLSLARLVLGAAARRPKVAAAYHDAGPGQALAGLVAFINHCQKSGELIEADPHLAAQNLWSLILSGPRDAHLHHVNRSVDRSELEDTIVHGLQVFLKAYSTSPDADLLELSRQTPPELHLSRNTSGGLEDWSSKARAASRK